MSSATENWAPLVPMMQWSGQSTCGAVGQLDRLEGLHARMARGERDVPGRVPVLGQDDIAEALGERVDRLDDLVAPRDGKTAAGEEVVLDVDDDKDVVGTKASQHSTTCWREQVARSRSPFFSKVVSAAFLGQRSARGHWLSTVSPSIAGVEHIAAGRAFMVVHQRQRQRADFHRAFPGRYASRHGLN